MANIALPPEVLAALQQGQTIEAIKLLRESSGLGLKEAKDLIDAHLQGHPAHAPSTFRRMPPDGLPPAVAAAIQQGHKIEAIRLMRELSGLGLKESKEAVEAAAASSSAGGGLSPGQVKSHSRGLWLLVAALLGATLAWYLVTD